MSEQREPTLRIIWTDPVTGRHGYAVIDRLIGGISGGGTRVRAGVTLDEVERLARTMTYKTGVMKVRSGGAKGAIDCDPRDPEMPAMLARFVEALKPVLSTCWATGEDLGIGQHQLDEIFAAAGLEMSTYAATKLSGDPEETQRRMAAALSIDVDGIGLGDVVGGYGVACAAEAGMEHVGIEPAQARAVVQGFGSIGGSSARYLAAQGVKIVGVVDATGAIVNEDGLDVEKLIAARDELGEIDRAKALSDGDRELPREEWLSIDCDVLIPAAIGDALTAGNSEQVRAKVVVEGANFPTTEEAQRLLHDRGVLVVPDFVANSGANSWFWWVLLGELGPEVDAQGSYELVRERVRGAVLELLARAEQDRITPREAAQALAQANLDAFEAEPVA